MYLKSRICIVIPIYFNFGEMFQWLPEMVGELQNIYLTNYKWNRFKLTLLLLDYLIKLDLLTRNGFYRETMKLKKRENTSWLSTQNLVDFWKIEQTNKKTNGRTHVRVARIEKNAGESVIIKISEFLIENFHSVRITEKRI